MNLAILWRTAAGGFVLGSLVGTTGRDVDVEASIRWRVEVEEEGARRALRVRMEAEGLSSAAGVLRVMLSSWGGWAGRSDPYVLELVSEPPLRRDPATPDARVVDAAAEWGVDAPAGWNGSLRVSYAIPVQRVGDGVEPGLLPWGDEADVGAFAINVLMDVRGAGGPVAARREIEFVAPRDRAIFTGWGGTSAGEQKVRFEHPIDNAPVVLGRLSGSSSADTEGIRYEVAQFGRGENRSAAVLRIASSLIPAYARHSGRAPDEPVRLVFFEAVTHNTHTDHGCILGYRPSEEPEPMRPALVHTIAHELFHDWLGAGGFIPGAEGIAWFHEGFTDYLSLWHAAAAGLLDQEWFAARMAAIDAEARRSPAFGKAALGDERGGWRDGMGPRETLAYRGGAVLAFGADVELRSAGRPGLMQMIADLGARRGGETTLEVVRDWMESHGLSGFYGRFVARPDLPDAAKLLAAVGFERTEVPAQLTYLGIRLGPGPDIGRVIELDPEGPAAAAGVEVGDAIRGYFPSRSERPRIDASVATPFRFGLERLEPGVAGAFVDVVRDGRESRLPITPGLVAGGWLARFIPDEPRTDAFFDYEPPP
jgi:hypothetical protein